MLRTSILAFSLSILLSHAGYSDVVVHNTRELVAAVHGQADGSVIRLSPGTYQLSETLELKSGMTLIGAGMEQTVVTHAAEWKPSTDSLPKGETRPDEADRNAYLIRFADKAVDITVSHLTLSAPQLHGAIFGVGNRNIQLHHLRIDNVLYSGIRVYSTKDSRIHDCEFVGAGGRWKHGGTPGVDGGISGGAIFATWMSDAEIFNNRFAIGVSDRRPGGSGNHFGIKGRGGRNIHIHHNTIGVNFAIEFPFEGADNFEIDHNILHGVVSIPKYAGGKVPESGVTYHIHHNYFTTSYAIEFVRNGVEIDHNLFDFDVEKDGGNLISAFGKAPASGPAVFHNNLVKNPGRGVIWINEPYNNLVIRNNHVVSRTTKTPRREGLFGFNRDCDFSTIRIVNNIFQCIGQPRPLLRNEESYGSVVKGNQLLNIADLARFDEPVSDSNAGLEHPLAFKCGVLDELTIDGWLARPTKDMTAEHRN